MFGRPDSRLYDDFKRTVKCWIHWGPVLVSGVDTANPRFSGVNFVPDNDSSIVLNQQGSTWSLYVKDVNVSKEVGLDVKLDPSTGQGNLAVSQYGKSMEGLPPTFTLQWSGKVICLGCSQHLKYWTRTSVN